MNSTKDKKIFGQNKEKTVIKIAGLWKRTGQNGDFLAGKLSDGVSILIFPNKKKQTANQPDFEVVIAQDKPKDQPEKPKITPKAPPSDGFGF